MSENGDRPELPDGWEWKTVGDVTIECRRGRPPAYEGGATLVINQKCVRGGTQVDLAHVKRTNEASKPLPGWAVLRDGDGLINSTGTGTLGRVGWLRSVPERMTLDTHVTLVRPARDQILSEYLGWWLHSREGDLVALATGSTNQKELGPEAVKALEIPVPPLEEQRRIVEKLELVLREIAAGEESIEWVRSGKSLYEEAVIAAALRGELSPQSEDSGSAMSYLEGRRISGTSDPSGVQCSFPSHWTVASLGELSSAVTSGSRDWKPYYNRGTSVFVLAGNVRMRRLDLQAKLHVDPPMDDPARKRSAVARDDLLLTIVGAGVGTIARVPIDLDDHFVCQSVALIRPSDADLSEYLELYLASRQGGQAYFETRYYGQGRPHLNFDDIKATPIPLPPPRERDAIVRTINARIAALDSLEGTLIESVAHAARLRRSAMNAILGSKAV